MISEKAIQILINTVPIPTKKTTDKAFNTDNKRNHTQILISFWFYNEVVVYRSTNWHVKPAKQGSFVPLY